MVRKRVGPVEEAGVLRRLDRMICDRGSRMRNIGERGAGVGRYAGCYVELHKRGGNNQCVEVGGGRGVW